MGHEQEGRGERGATVRASIDLAIDIGEAFDVLIDELVGALERAGIAFEPGADGRVVEDGFEVGRVVAWTPGRGLLLRWRPASWKPEETTEVELTLEAVPGGTRAVVEHRGFGPLVGDAAERAGWFADRVAAPLLRASAPATLGDWLTDRAARRPTGARARAVYADPLYHRPGFRAILDELALGPADYLLEVGCGGGALLREVLRSGCRAAAVDHSADMVRVAREQNRAAVADGRLDVRHASADRLPFPDATFTCAVMTGVLGFLPDPVAALAEMRRVLVAGGRIVVFGTDPELRGTPAAPEPMASRLRFTDSDELARLGVAAGFTEVRVERRELEAYAREAGIPEEHLPLYRGPGARFLLARKA